MHCTPAYYHGFPQEYCKLKRQSSQLVPLPSLFSVEEYGASETADATMHNEQTICLSPNVFRRPGCGLYPSFIFCTKQPPEHLPCRCQLCLYSKEGPRWRPGVILLERVTGTLFLMSKVNNLGAKGAGKPAGLYCILTEVRRQPQLALRQRKYFPSS